MGTKSVYGWRPWCHHCCQGSHCSPQWKKSREADGGPPMLGQSQKTISATTAAGATAHASVSPAAAVRHSRRAIVHTLHRAPTASVAVSSAG